MLTPGEIWPMIAGSAVVVFGAGQLSGKLIEKLRNGKYVEKGFCSKQHEIADDRWKRVEESLHEIKAWINKGGVP